MAIVRTKDDLTTIGATGIRQAIITCADVLADYPDISDRVGLSAVDAKTPMPYVRMAHSWGFNDNKTLRKSFDMTWVVEAISDDQQEASNLAVLMKFALEGVHLPYPGNWEAWAPCTVVMPHALQFELQGHEYFAIGSTFRLRGALTIV